MPRGAPFPRDVDEFKDDQRISWSLKDSKWVLEDDNGEEWEFNEVAKAWNQPATAEEVEAYQRAYGGPYDDSKASPDNDLDNGPLKRKAEAPAGNDAKKPKAQQENRAVYITGLPLDTTVEEIEEEFSKFGIIDVGVDNRPRIKMYGDENGNFKGDALVTYFKKDSVPMAIQLMDDSWFRPGMKSTIKVQAAEMSYKKHTDKDDISKKLSRQNRKDFAAKRADMNKRLTAWSDDEDDDVKTKSGAPTNHWAKNVVVKGAFTLEELRDDPQARGDIEADMREEGEEIGKVTNVVIYDLEPEGIVVVKFEDLDDAKKFVEKNNGRLFASVKLQVYHAQDNPKSIFRKTERYLNEEEQEAYLESLLAVR